MVKHEKGQGKLYQDGKWMADVKYDFEIRNEHSAPFRLTVMRGDLALVSEMDFELELQDGRSCSVGILVAKMGTSGEWYLAQLAKPGELFGG